MEHDINRLIYTYSAIVRNFLFGNEFPESTHNGRVVIRDYGKKKIRMSHFVIIIFMYE